MKLRSRRIGLLFSFLASTPIVMKPAVAFSPSGFMWRPFVTIRASPFSSSTIRFTIPKEGNVVESYQTVSVNCAKCQERLFRYKKKNGTKSSLVKCYIERISEDSVGLLEAQIASGATWESFDWRCPICETIFARPAMIHGRPALKIVGGKVRMTKK